MKLSPSTVYIVKNCKAFYFGSVMAKPRKNLYSAVIGVT